MDVSHAIREAAQRTVREHPETVAAWLANEPGAWGRLAGRAVLAAREALGRALTDQERRTVWATLWARLEALRAP